MDDLNDVYNELIMEQSMNSYHKKKLPTSDYQELGHNPSCGDEITLEVKMQGNIIEDMAFTGHGCAISQASTSIMIDTLKGKTVEEARDIMQLFIRMIQREELTEQEMAKLGEAAALQNVQHMPARVKCALLAWRTLENILQKRES